MGDIPEGPDGQRRGLVTPHKASAGTAVCAMLAFISFSSATAYAAGLIDYARLGPTGTRYEATVPDTLDLAERARLAVHGLTGILNPQANYGPYGHWYFNNPPYLSDLPMGPPNWGKIAESLVMARLMCGSEENLDIEQKMIEGMLSLPVERSPNVYAYSRDYVVINPVAPTPLSRAMLALVAIYQLDPNPQLRARLDSVADAHVRAARHQDHYAYYADLPEDTRETGIGVLGYWMDVFINGCAARALVRWSDLRGDDKYLEPAGQLVNHILRSKYWGPQPGQRVVAQAERGHFSGHIHAYTQALMGVLWYAEATGDARLKEFVRSGYEYVRDFGIARLGLFGEGCGTGDMTFLALKLSDLGVGDYWDDADQYVRNHLAELQMTDADALRRATETMPSGRGAVDPQQGPFDPFSESADGVVERTVGTFLSDGTHPTLIPERAFMATVCCTGNCVPALYFAWESIVRCEDGVAQVNLLLNRASPWLDIESYLPYEGKVVIRNKSARILNVRIPKWVERGAVRSQIGDRPVEAFWAGRYLVFNDLKPEATVTVTFPVVETTETYTLKWKQSDFWQESTNPGDSWRPLEEPARYTCRFRGNTLVDISPRDEGPGYPLYLRDALTRSQAPMRQVTRYVPPRLVRW